MENIKIRIGLVDEEIKSDVTISNNFEFKNFFWNTSEILENNVTFINYATLEKNVLVLNSEKQFLEENNNSGTGVCSKALSDENGIFTVPLTLYINLSNETTIKDINIVFDEDSYPTDVHVEFYLNDVLKYAKNFYPDNYEYTFSDENGDYSYNKVALTFKKTNYPYRYLKIKKVDFGRIVTFESEQVVSCNILEEIDPISNEVSVNTAEFEIHSYNDDFNMFNPKGIYSKLKLNQPVEIYHILNDSTKFMGKFYLTEWTSESQDTGSFKAQDLLGYLDNVKFNSANYSYFMHFYHSEGSDGYFTYDIETLISDVFNKAGSSYSDYIENTNIYDFKKFFSVITPCSLKEALQKACFSVGAKIDCSRSKKIIITPLEELEIPLTISNDKIFMDTINFKKINNPNSINIYGYNYMNESNDETINVLYKATFDNENLLINTEYTITFDEPKYYIDIPNFALSMSHGFFNPLPIDLGDSVTVVDWSPYHVTFKAETIGANIEILGNDIKNYKTLVNYNYVNNEVENAVTIDCDLIAYDSSIYSDAQEVLAYSVKTSDIANRLREYYKYNYEISCEIILNDEKVGDYVCINTDYNTTLVGWITSLDIDVLNGTAKMKMIGRIKDVDNTDN